MFLMHMDGEHWIPNARWDAGDTDSSPQALLLRQTLLPDCLLSCCSGRQHPRQVAWGVRTHGISQFSSSHYASCTPAPALCLPGRGERWLGSTGFPKRNTLPPLHCAKGRGFFQQKALHMARRPRERWTLNAKYNKHTRPCCSTSLRSQLKH